MVLGSRGEDGHPFQELNFPIYQRLKMLIVQKNQDSTIHNQLFKKYRGLSKHIFALIRFTYVSTISGFQRFIKIPPSYFPFFWKRSLAPIVLDPPNICFGRCEKTNIYIYILLLFPTNWCPALSNILKILNLQNVEMCDM